MKISRLLSRISLSVITIVTLQTSTINPVDSQTEKAFLWSLESANNTIYILGSIHVLKPEDYPLPAIINEVFQDAEHLMFEVDISQLNSFNTLQIFQQKALPDAPNEAIENALDTQTYQLVQGQIEQIGLPIQTFEQYEPWFLYLMITSMHILQSGYDPNYGVDRYLFQAGINANKKISALETIEEQLDFFDSMSISTQTQLLKQSILEINKTQSELDSLANAWKSGNVDQLSDLLLASFQEYPELQQVFFIKRNQNWLAQIEPLINQSDDYLIVVGAGHLVGNDSLIKLMEKEGYKLKQL